MGRSLTTSAPVSLVSPNPNRPTPPPCAPAVARAGIASSGDCRRRSNRFPSHCRLLTGALRHGGCERDRSLVGSRSSAGSMLRSQARRLSRDIRFIAFRAPVTICSNSSNPCKRSTDSESVPRRRRGTSRSGTAANRYPNSNRVCRKIFISQLDPIVVAA